MPYHSKTFAAGGRHNINRAAEASDDIYIYDDGHNPPLFVFVEDSTVPIEGEYDEDVANDIREAANAGDYFDISLWVSPKDPDEYDFNRHIDSIGGMAGYGGARLAACAAIQEYFTDHLTSTIRDSWLDQLGCKNLQRQRDFSRDAGSERGLELELDGLGRAGQQRQWTTKQLQHARWPGNDEVAIIFASLTDDLDDRKKNTFQLFILGVNHGTFREDANKAVKAFTDWQTATGRHDVPLYYASDKAGRDPELVNVDAFRAGVERFGGLGAMQKRKREKVANLNPLTQKQIEYLDEMAVHYVRDATVPAFDRMSHAWWLYYYGISRDEDWSNPYATFEPKAYEHWMTALAETLQEARTNKTLWANLVAAGSLPPNPPKGDPYGLPEYLGWWQAENAFRRAYQREWDGEFLNDLEQRLRREVRAEGKLTDSTMRDMARHYQHDPATAQFFTELAEVFRAGNAPNYGKMSKFLEAIKDYRDNAYIQFSPYHVPERAVGSFFFGTPAGVGAAPELELEDAGLIYDSRRGGFDLVIGGKRMGYHRTRDKAVEAFAKWCERHNYWPDLYYVNERGMVDQLDPVTGEFLAGTG